MNAQDKRRCLLNKLKLLVDEIEEKYCPAHCGPSLPCGPYLPGAPCGPCGPCLPCDPYCSSGGCGYSPQCCAPYSPIPLPPAVTPTGCGGCTIGCPPVCLPPVCPAPCCGVCTPSPGCGTCPSPMPCGPALCPAPSCAPAGPCPPICQPICPPANISAPMPSGALAVIGEGLGVGGGGGGCPPMVCCKRTKSRELRASVMLSGCDCVKHNGLQDHCPRTECRGAPCCRTLPDASCCPALQTYYKQLLAMSNLRGPLSCTPAASNVSPQSTLNVGVNQNINSNNMPGVQSVVCPPNGLCTPPNLLCSSLCYPCPC